MLRFFYSLKIHATILFEPLVASLVIGENAEYFVIELTGMIHVAAVAEFVNHDAVQNFWRHENKQAVEVEISVYRAAAPAGLLQADKDFVVGNAGEFCVVLYPLRNHYPRLFLNLLDIFSICLVIQSFFSLMKFSATKVGVPSGTFTMTFLSSATWILIERRLDFWIM